MKGESSHLTSLNILFTSHQLIYGYVETDGDNDNDDKIDRNPDFHFKDKSSFTSHTTDKV